MRRTALAALLLTAWFPLSATAASVTVRSGETLSDIADRYGVSVGTLMRMNGIRNPDLVEAGSRLQVPGPTVTAGSGRHRVKSGETLGSIASLHATSKQHLLVVLVLSVPTVAPWLALAKLRSHLRSVRIRALVLRHV